MIEITTRNILKKGEKWVEILEVKCLDKQQLPDRYIDLGIDGKGSVFYSFNRAGSRPIYFNPSNSVGIHKGIHKYIGDKMSLLDFEKMISTAREAGENLSRINKELEVENQGWDGTVRTYVI